MVKVNETILMCANFGVFFVRIVMTRQQKMWVGEEHPIFVNILDSKL